MGFPSAHWQDNLMQIPNRLEKLYLVEIIKSKIDNL